MEQNHLDQKTLQILLETNPGSFDGDDTTALRAIAVQCPDEGGNAVWEARSLMALLGEIIDGYDCDSSSKMAPGRSNFSQAEGWVNVWPNPTSKEVFVKLGGKAAEGGVFLVHNLQGREKVRVSMESALPNLVPLGEQPSGTYFWTFIPKSGNAFRGKVVVVK